MSALDKIETIDDPISVEWFPISHRLDSAWRVGIALA